MKIEREVTELGDIIVNGKLTIQELYDFAKENGYENNFLYFIGREKGKIFSDIYTHEITTFGRGWSKDTIILKFDYQKEKLQGSSPG